MRLAQGVSREWLAVLVLVLVLGMAGCADDEIADTGGGDPVVPPEHPDPVEIFVHAIAGFDLPTLSNLFHEDFQLQVLPSTYDQWVDAGNPLESMIFDRGQTLSMLTRIFEQEEGLDWRGTTVPPVASIEYLVMDKEGAWELVGENVEFFGGYSGVYRASYSSYVHFIYPGSFRFVVIQIVDIYVIQTEDNEFSFLGMVPQEPDGKSVTDVLSFENMLSLYR